MNERDKLEIVHEMINKVRQAVSVLRGSIEMTNEQITELSSIRDRLSHLKDFGFFEAWHIVGVIKCIERLLNVTKHLSSSEGIDRMRNHYANYLLILTAYKEELTGERTNIT